ncbi:hypothetical protein [Vreelandella alkaliphila]|nr:hypothetical protein [Halomonas alkaliphila]
MVFIDAGIIHFIRLIIESLEPHQNLRRGYESLASMAFVNGDENTLDHAQ